MIEVNKILIASYYIIFDHDLMIIKNNKFILRYLNPKENATIELK